MVKRVLLVLGLLTVLLMTGCGGEGEGDLPRNLSVQQVKEQYDAGNAIIIDVREQNEYDAGHIPGVHLIPLGTLPARISEIPTDQTVIIVCRSGNRSDQAVTYLEDQGLTNIHNMLGGMNQWSSAGYPME